MKFVVDGKEKSFDTNNLPLLIHGENGLGVSHFSLCVIAEYMSSGSKIVFLTQFPDAAESLKKLGPKNADIYYVESTNQFAEATNHQVAVIKSGDTKLCEDYMKECTDIDQRIIFLKNIETTLTDGLWSFVESSNKIVLSGDIKKSRFYQQILHKVFSTKIMFSEIEEVNSTNFPILSQYTAQIVSEDNKGIVRVVN